MLRSSSRFLFSLERTREKEEVNCTVNKGMGIIEIGEEINKEKIEELVGQRLCEKIKLPRHRFLSSAMYLSGVLNDRKPL